jgi:hypothetical protein
VELLLELAIGLSALVAGAVALRLLGVAWRTGSAPHALMGITVGIGGAAVQLLILTASILRATADSAAGRALFAGTLLCVGVGATAMARFNHAVYRPRSPLLHAVTGAVAGYFGLVAVHRAFGLSVPPLLALEAFYAALLVLYTWSALEAFHSWDAYRRTPGLDALVVERFRIWGFGLLATMSWILCETVGRGNAASRAAGVLFAILASTANCFAFAPPRWYRARLGEAAPHGA